MKRVAGKRLNDKSLNRTRRRNPSTVSPPPKSTETVSPLVLDIIWDVGWTVWGVLTDASATSERAEQQLLNYCNCNTLTYVVLKIFFVLFCFCFIERETQTMRSESRRCWCCWWCWWDETSVPHNPDDHMMRSFTLQTLRKINLHPKNLGRQIKEWLFHSVIFTFRVETLRGLRNLFGANFLQE